MYRSQAKHTPKQTHTMTSFIVFDETVKAVKTRLLEVSAKVVRRKDVPDVISIKDMFTVNLKPAEYVAKVSFDNEGLSSSLQDIYSRFINYLQTLDDTDEPTVHTFLVSPVLEVDLIHHPVRLMKYEKFCNFAEKKIVALQNLTYLNELSKPCQPNKPLTRFTPGAEYFVLAPEFSKVAFDMDYGSFAITCSPLKVAVMPADCNETVSTLVKALLTTEPVTLQMAECESLVMPDGYSTIQWAFLVQLLWDTKDFSDWQRLSFMDTTIETFQDTVGLTTLTTTCRLVVWQLINSLNGAAHSYMRQDLQELLFLLTTFLSHLEVYMDECPF